MNSSSRRPPRPHRFAYDGLDRVIHERARLSVLTSLVTHPKGFGRSRPQTLCRITPQGRKRYLDYLAVLEQVVVDAATAVKGGSDGKAVLSLART